MEIIQKFLVAEMNSQELYEDIYRFIVSFHIRNGEFEGNEYIIKKMDADNFLLFPEYFGENGSRDIPFAISLYKKQLIAIISKEAEKREFVVLHD